MAINNIPGVGPTNADIATAVAAPSASTIAAAVAAPSAAAIVAAGNAAGWNSAGPATYSIYVNYGTTTPNATATVSLPAGTYTYQIVPSAITGTVNGVLFGGSSFGAFVNPSSASSITVANYGTNWASSASSTTSTLQAIAYGNGVFVAGGLNGAVVTSPDGVNWTSRTSGFGANAIRGVAFGNGTFLIVGENNVANTSTNGITWTARTTGFAAGANISCVAYGPQGFIVGTSNGNGARITTDGVTWSAANANFGIQSIYSAAYGNGIYALGGEGQSPQNITTATDGVNYTKRNDSLGGSRISAIAYGNGIWVAGSTGPGIYATSPDAVTWTSRSFGVTNITITGIAYGNGIFAAAGADRQMLVSTNGTSWVSRSMSSTNTMQAITFGGTGFVAVANGGSIVTSNAPTGLIVLTAVSSAVQAS